MEMRKVEIQAAQVWQSAVGGSDWPPLNTGWDNFLAGRTKMYGDMLKHVLSPMPNETAELPQFFDTVGRIFFAGKK